MTAEEVRIAARVHVERELVAGGELELGVQGGARRVEQVALGEHLLGQLQLMVVHERLVDDHDELLARLQRLDDAARAGVTYDQIGLDHVRANRALVRVGLDQQALFHAELDRCAARHGGERRQLWRLVHAVAHLHDKVGARERAEQAQRALAQHLVHQLLELGRAHRYEHSHRVGWCRYSSALLVCSFVIDLQQCAFNNYEEDYY